MDNIGNYEMINVPYGSMLETTFSLVGSINNPPDFEGDKWLDNEKTSTEEDSEEKGVFSQQVFPFSRAKAGDNFGDGFIEVTNPSVIIYLVRYLFILFLLNIIFKYIFIFLL